MPACARFQLCAARIALASALWWAASHAQAQSLPPPPDTAATAGTASPLGAPPAAAPPLPGVGIEQADSSRMRELTRLAAQREQLLASNRRWQVPLVGLPLGLLSLIIGGNQLLSAGALGSSDCVDCKSHDEEAGRRFLAGTALVAIGSALILVATPMLITRGSRASRLRRVELEMTRLGGKLTLAPTLAPRAEAGLRARFAF